MTKNHFDMKHLKIGTTDVFLDDKGEGSGKIVISDDEYGYDFSYYWGSMGCSLEEFLLGINEDYFEGKLNMGDMGVFDGKASVRNIRRYIKEDLAYELPWYIYPSAQKELRKRLREIEDYCCSEDEFINDLQNLPDNLICFDLTYQEERDFKQRIESLGEEPWHFIEKKPSNKTIWLKKFLPKLKSEIKKAIKSSVLV